MTRTITENGDEIPLTIDVNGKRYRLNEDFREDIERLARAEYGSNNFFDCSWGVARRHHYSDDEWSNNVHEEGDPLLIIETVGTRVPWDDLDELEAEMGGPMDGAIVLSGGDDDQPEEHDAGNGMKTVDPDPPDRNDIFGRTHFPFTPRRYEELPTPDSKDPTSIPPEREQPDGAEMVIWLPRHPDVEHTWEAGDAMIEVDSWVEWNVQQRANQPIPSKGKSDMHDRFESLCEMHDCPVIDEYEPSDQIDASAGSVQRKGEDWFEGDVVGDRWRV